MSYQLESIQVGLPCTLGQAGAADPMEREWTTALFKEPVEGVVEAEVLGLAGDGQADRNAHGGVDMAINVYPREHLAYWWGEYGLDFQPGAFGENFSTTGFVESEVCVGDRYEVGELLVEVSQPRQPCWKIARRWRIKDLAAQVEKTGYTGWYLRVLRGGAVASGKEFYLVERPYPEWSVAEVNSVRFHRKRDGEASFRLGQCAALSQGWREFFLKRAKKLGAGPDEASKMCSQ